MDVVPFSGAALFGVLLGRVVDGFVAQKLAANVATVLTSIIRHQVRIWRKLRFENRLESFSVNVRDVEGAGRTVTLDQRKNLVFMRVPARTTIAMARHRLRLAP